MAKEDKAPDTDPGRAVEYPQTAGAVNPPAAPPNTVYSDGTSLDHTKAATLEAAQARHRAGLRVNSLAPHPVQGRDVDEAGLSKAITGEAKEDKDK